ncbi:N-acetyltransferase [Lachnoclostridium sp. Marseille-P6806]|uniref:N-acetyltransferase n=1 Tax=Lachnoclostridium sp. Marseille-P6806 TaxID=2364793 RepID=UPI00103196FE|nr:N-acetyltransferase [Lachnoclostridium sp. Marseille-P6806]
MIAIQFEKERRRAAAYDGSRLVGECEIAAGKTFWVITHTEVNQEYGGQGIAGELVDCVVQEAKTEGMRIKPFCSYAAHLVEKNPAYAEIEDKTVITVYGMSTCPDCAYVAKQIRGRDDFRMVDIGGHVKDLKAFLRLRDAEPAFAGAKENACVGIPCFVLEDGTVTLSPEDVGLRAGRPEAAACRLDGTGC